jgi:hypothetical protein
MANFSGISNWFSDFLKVDPKTGLVSMGASLGRRMAERQYDKLIKTPFLQSLKEKDRPTKLAFETALNALVAFLDQKINTSSVLGQIAEQIFLDAGSEINKRILNGESSVKEILIEKADQMNETELNFFSVLLAMDEEKLKSFLEWLISMKETEKREILKILKTFSQEDLENFSGMDQGAKELFFEAFKKGKPSSSGKPIKEQFRSFLKKRLERKKEAGK